MYGQTLRFRERFSNSLQICLLLSLFILLFGHTITKLVRDWSTNDSYSHGFLIPFIVGYMIWNKRAELSVEIVNTGNTGLFIVTVGMMLHVLGSIGAELFTMRVAMLVTLYGLLLVYAGNIISLKLAFPIAYLLFMVPVPALIWNSISFPLQLLASKLAGTLIGSIGIPVLREGNVLCLANGSLEVVDACSGLRSLISLLALSAAFAYLSSLDSLKKWILFFSAIPVALIMNILRLTLTALLAHSVGEDAATKGILHEFSGVLTFGGGLMLTYLVYLVLMQRTREQSTPARTYMHP